MQTNEAGIKTIKERIEQDLKDLSILLREKSMANKATLVTGHAQGLCTALQDLGLFPEAREYRGRLVEILDKESGR